MPLCKTKQNLTHARPLRDSSSPQSCSLRQIVCVLRSSAVADSLLRLLPSTRSLYSLENTNDLPPTHQSSTKPFRHPPALDMAVALAHAAECVDPEATCRPSRDTQARLARASQQACSPEHAALDWVHVGPNRARKVRLQPSPCQGGIWQSTQ
eukprot:3495183-Rhodomonas_salina.2